MAQNNSSAQSELAEIKKSVDRLALIELCKGGATRDEIRDVMGKVDNNLLSKINKALKKSPRPMEDR